MGFGSYDESEQERQELDVGDDDDDEDDGVRTGETDHKGDVEYEIGASNDELLDRLQDIKDET